MNIFTLPQTEESAIHFLKSKWILPTNKICVNGHEMKLSIGKQVRWRCGKSTCRSETALRVAALRNCSNSKQHYEFFEWILKKIAELWPPK
ncbi:hypothetical protein ACQ4LE_001838 [Meloidogyne hapla]